MAATGDASRGMKRRGILAAAGAVVAGMVAKRAAEGQPVAAGVDGDLVLNSSGQTIVGTTSMRTDNSWNQIIGPNAFAVDCSATTTRQLTAIAGVGTGGGIGVQGTSSGGTGVFGQTNASNNYGVLGQTFAPNSTAIAGTCTQNGSSAFSGGTTNPNAFAAFFQGTVVVQGNFAVTGAKSAVVQHPRTGDHRLVYCVESPESWFEDFGEGTLAGGKATVALDPNFTALIHTDAYHVFLTPGADSNGLYVTNKTASGFVVQEQHGGTSTLAFSWRVVGKRADTKGERLGKFVMPNLPLPDVSKFKAPDLPTSAVPPTRP